MSDPAAAPTLTEPAEPVDDTRRVVILGSTGSIGTQTIEVIEHLNALHAQGRWPMRFDVVGLAAGRNADALALQADRLGVRDVAISTGDVQLSKGRSRSGPDAATHLVRDADCDLVLSAMVGFAGLPATLEAVNRGIDVALANKETLVAAGELVVPASVRSGAAILPVDSEHSAIWQCLNGAHRTGDVPALRPPVDLSARIESLILTASGGPFRESTADEVYNATPDDALRHPNWNMGPKVTIDSASLTNKALEVIEAHWLYGLPGESIGVLVHPQSIVHSLVTFDDGTMIAQLGAPDMRAPIQYALTFPNRAPACGDRLTPAGFADLSFAEPDTDRFPALKLAYDVIEMGGTAGAVFNGANERAVEFFLERRIPFGRIAELAAEAVRSIGASPLRDLDDAIEADHAARALVDRIA